MKQLWAPTALTILAAVCSLAAASGAGGADSAKRDHASTESLSVEEAHEIVRRAYKDLLYREPEPEALEAFTFELVERRRDETGLRDILRRSGEGRRVAEKERRTAPIWLVVGASLLFAVAALFDRRSRPAERDRNDEASAQPASQRKAASSAQLKVAASRFDALLFWLLAGLESPGHPGPRRLQEGWSIRMPVLSALALLAFPLSGLVRAVGNLSMSMSLIVAGGICLAIGLLSWRTLAEARAMRRVVLAGLLFVMVGLLFCWSELFNPYFLGFPGYAGGDAGNHIWIQHLFVRENPSHYHGMVTFHAAAHWIERLAGVDSFVSYRAIFYGAVAALVMFLAVSGGALVATSVEGRDSGWRIFPLLAVIAWYPATTVVLPQLHYFQADGFLTQVFSIVPILLAACLYSTSRYRVGRVFALLFCIVLTRYTYAMNVGDLSLCAALLVGWDGPGPHASRYRRLSLLALSAGLVVLSTLVYARLYPLGFEAGGILRIPIAPLVLGTAILSVLLLTSPLTSRLMGVPLPEIGRRLFSFCGIFGLVGALVHGLWLFAQLPREYLFYKYSFANVVVASLGAVVYLSYLGTTLWSPHRYRAVGLLALSMACAIGGFGFRQLAVASRPYLPSYLERAMGAPPWSYLVALEDRTGSTIIRRYLEETGLQFGGLLTPSWPESVFSNANLGFPRRPWDPYESSSVITEPNYAVFWHRLSVTRRLPGPPGQRAQASKLAASLALHPNFKSWKYYPAHSPESAVELCSVSFTSSGQSGTRASLPDPEVVIEHETSRVRSFR